MTPDTRNQLATQKRPLITTVVIVLVSTILVFGIGYTILERARTVLSTPTIDAAFDATFSAPRKDCLSFTPGAFQYLVWPVGFVFPPSAKNLESRCVGRLGLGSVVTQARFDILPSDLFAFLRSTRVKTPLSASTLPDNASVTFLGLSNPKSIKSYLYGRYSENGVYGQEVLVDTGDPDRYIVYISAYAS